ncbi:PP2C family protein-serine/threonine phosphatase [Candidatus Latescibacterota bacterium]
MYLMNAAGLTDTGKIRKNNEDNFFVDNPLLIVADGMGGAVGGEIASSIAVKTISESLKNITYTTDSEIAEALKQALIKADSEIKEQTYQNPDLKGMGTTIVTALHIDTRVLIANIGDSRAYLITGTFMALAPSSENAKPVTDSFAETAIFKAIDLDEKKPFPGNISRITEDHSVVMELVRSGIIEEHEIRTHPLRNRITKCAGSTNNNEPDIFWQDITDGDVLVMCSDGLWEMVHEDIIYAIVTSSKNLEETCKRLIDAANDAGGSDNITVVTAQFLKE